ncbi:uncharacterized protein F4822DRAFT_249840 [Hypoxylon trugodes]|uniref:uncharacterized protein n=1 Tax=Hypoxylon trugodes TaxID=326681 RepID=UPI00218EF80A|nr:uncharacterized protein F4822DRAFT_249840 [Hypoxylon trugodes]KAI1388547.1 hypothetical protein F4822DRAFT_249840 [Hypoxylon trugodes]
MVGVAGKSQACNACRQKRLKCDLTRPSCLKCIKSGKACTGYSRDLIFVNRTPLDRSITATSVLSERRAQQQQQKGGTVNSNAETELHLLFSESSHDNEKFRKHAIKILEATYLPKQLVPSNSKPETNEGSFSWVYYLTDLTEPSKSLDTSLFAFCLTQLHITGTDQVSLYECLEQYNAALQHLSSDLDDLQKRSQEETLAAIIVLSTCELFVCPAGGGWGVHARGLAEIIRLRDPETPNTPAWRHLFSRLRIVCTLDALTKRQARILENNIWHQIVAESGFTGPLDEVYTIISDVPAILEQAVALPSIDDLDIFSKKSAVIIQSVLDVAEAVRSWRDEFCKPSSKPHAWLVPSSVTNPAETGLSDKMFPLCFEFESLGVAVPIVMCWSVAAQLYSHVIQIFELAQTRLGRHITLEYILAQVNPTQAGAMNLSQSSNQDVLIPAVDDVQKRGTEMAHCICQSLEYFHRIEMGTYGGHATTYPSWSARQYFRLHAGHERERLWLQNLHKMEGPGTRWGLSLMTFADIIKSLSDLSG